MPPPREQRWLPPAGRYLDVQHLEALKGYKYRGVDHSVLAELFMTRWWNFVASFMPPWLAPNTITTIGFSFILCNLVTIAAVMPDLEGPAPRWLYFGLALGLFAYQTADNVDGKQARKTGTSSPLGQLFDHVIDSLNCPLGGFIQAAAMGLGHSKYTVFFIVVSTWPMYLSAHEEWHTGVLYLGPVNGPVEGLLIACSVMLVSAFCGSEIWQQSTVQALPAVISTFLPKDVLLSDLFMLFVLFALVVGHAPACFLHVWQSTDGNPAAFLRALSRLTPLFVLTLTAGLWATSPYSVLLAEMHLLEFAWIVAFLFGRMATEVILAHLTRGTFPDRYGMFVPLVLISVLVNVPAMGGPIVLSPSGERWLMHVLLAYYGATFLWMTQTIIDRFCATLNIRCFTIPPSRTA